MIILLKLLLAHLIGDFVLQPKEWVRKKEHAKAKSYYLYLHVAIHAGLMLLTLADLRLWPVVMAIALAHLSIDTAKLYLQTEKTRTQWFIMDQLLHIGSICIVYYAYFQPLVDWYAMAQNPKLWLLLIAITLLIFVAPILIPVLMSRFSKAVDIRSHAALAKAGRYIGILERLMVFLFIILGHWEAVGFLIAAKSIFRFGDLTQARDRQLTEYVLIGTLLSFGLAVAIGFGFTTFAGML